MTRLLRDPHADHPVREGVAHAKPATFGLTPNLQGMQGMQGMFLTLSV